MKRFGEKLRKLREGHDLSYSQLAKQLGFHRGHLANIEIGARIPSVDLVEKIVAYFNVSFDEMMDDKMEVNLKQSKQKRQRGKAPNRSGRQRA